VFALPLRSLPLPPDRHCGITEGDQNNPMRECPVADFATRRTLMVDTQIRPSDVTKFPIIEAMLAIPRELYVPARLREAAYVGENLDLGGGRVILEPRTFAKMMDALDLRPSDVVLDLGCGLGYSTAVLARLVEFVVAVEEDAAHAEDAQATLSDQGVDNAAVMKAPLVEGAPKSGPYDAIVVQGAVVDMPQAVLDQLQEGGRIAAIFVDGQGGAQQSAGLGVARIGRKTDGRVSWRYAFNAGAPVLPGFARATEFQL
jgi:protein-L-isoaspartate(D-aspartate) O-methyltransferase